MFIIDKDTWSFGLVFPDSSLMDHIKIADIYVPSFQQHLNIMRSTEKLQTSEFVELPSDFP